VNGWNALRDRYQVTADPQRTQRQVELVVLLLGLVLLLQLLYSAMKLSFLSPPDPLPPAMDIFQGKEMSSMAAVAVKQSDEIRARPLFWLSRRFVEPAPAAVDAASAEAQKEAGKLKDVKLLGVFGSGDTSGIIVVVKKKKRRVMHGESIEGWTLDAVESDHVVLVNGARRKELVLLPVNLVNTENTPVPNNVTGKSKADAAVHGKDDATVDAKNKDLPPMPSREGRMGVRSFRGMAVVK
jgi:hypothetical protein